MPRAKLNPTLFDKLIVNARLVDVIGDGSAVDAPDREAQRFYTVSDLTRFNETALRATVRRELAWLFNTTSFDSGSSLDAYPHVRTSVLNYGMPDLTGRISNARSVRERTDQIAKAISAFEPRMDASKISVEARLDAERDNAVTFVINGDVTAAVNAMPVQFMADVEIDTGEAVVRD